MVGVLSPSCSRSHSWMMLWKLTVDPAEEFAIYLNYVRKLGFEEAPDYDFLRELFTKVLKNRGEVDDGIYDWMTIHGGKGWEAGVSAFSSFFSLFPPSLSSSDRRESYSL